MIKMDSLEEQLRGFYGTEAYHAATFGRVQLTDGVHFLREKANCFWLIDIVESVQHLDSIKQNAGFILWIIDVREDKTATVRALTDSPGTGEVLYTQELTYTDFPLNHFEFYQEGDVLLLKSEH